MEENIVQETSTPSKGRVDAHKHFTQSLSLLLSSYFLSFLKFNIFESDGLRG